MTARWKGWHSNNSAPLHPNEGTRGTRRKEFSKHKINVKTGGEGFFFLYLFGTLLLSQAFLFLSASARTEGIKAKRAAGVDVNLQSKTRRLTAVMDGGYGK